MIARTTAHSTLVIPMGNYVSDRVGNYVSARPLQLGNSVSADNHDTGRVVWVGKDRSQAAFNAFFDALGQQRTEKVAAISLDASSIYKTVAADRIPQATICLDPFHVIGWAGEVVDAAYRAEAPRFPLGDGRPSRRDWRRTRYAIRAGKERLDPRHHTLLGALRRHSYRLWRTWELKEQLRDLYRIVDPTDAADYLHQWCTTALRSRIPAYETLVRRIRKHFDAIVAAVQLGLSNSRLEGINAKIRLIQRRGYGHANIDNLTAMIYLCLGGITITLPSAT